MNIYKSTQMISNEMLSWHRLWFTPQYYLLQIALISFTYTLIRYNTIVPVIISLFCAACSIALLLQGYNLYQQAVNMRIAAQQCVDSHLRRSRLTDNAHMLWRSCKPPVVQIGQQFTISSRNYCLKVFGHNIFQAIVDLLVSFK